SATEDLFWNARFGRIEARRRSFGILCGTFGVIIRSIPIAAPFPDVARHVVKPITVGRETCDRRRPAETVGSSIFVWKPTLPNVRRPFSVGRLLVAPNIPLAVQATS